MSTAPHCRQKRPYTNMAPLDDHPELNLTPDEKRYYGQLFKQASDSETGIVSGDVAYNLFLRSNLSHDELGQIWGLADSDNRGFLTQEDFVKALRLIGHTQAQPGRAPDLSMALQRKSTLLPYS